jgi:hypothetical protein
MKSVAGKTLGCSTENLSLSRLSFFLADFRHF